MSGIFTSPVKRFGLRSLEMHAVPFEFAMISVAHVSCEYVRLMASHITLIRGSKPRSCARQYTLELLSARLLGDFDASSDICPPFSRFAPCTQCHSLGVVAAELCSRRPRRYALLLHALVRR